MGMFSGAYADVRRQYKKMLKQLSSEEQVVGGLRRGRKRKLPNKILNSKKLPTGTGVGIGYWLHRRNSAAQESSGIVARAILRESLSEEMRKRIPRSDFVYTRKKRKGMNTKGKYPIDTIERARSALRLVGMHGTPAEKARVRAAVKNKWGIG